MTPFLVGFVLGILVYLVIYVIWSEFRRGKSPELPTKYDGEVVPEGDSIPKNNLDTLIEDLKVSGVMFDPVIREWVTPMNREYALEQSRNTPLGYGFKCPRILAYSTYHALSPVMFSEDLSKDKRMSARDTMVKVYKWNLLTRLKMERGLDMYRLGAVV